MEVLFRYALMIIFSMICSLSASKEENVDDLLSLGRLYVTEDRKDEAIELYHRALALHPERQDIRTALAFAYLFQNNLEESKKQFQATLNAEPDNPDAIAGLGRIAAFEGHLEEAEHRYRDALRLDPKNTTALAYLAALQSLQKKYYTADDTYQYLIKLDPDNTDTRKNYNDFLEARRPKLDFSAYYEEENEKDPITSEWDARLKNYGAAITFLSPVMNRLKMIANVAGDYIVLKGLVTHTTIYSLDIQRPKLGFIWNHTPYLAITGGTAMAFFSQYSHSTYYTKRDWYCLPFFNISYFKKPHTCTFETLGDAPIVARNFNANKSTLVARQFLNGLYEYDLEKRRAIGAAASYAWYYNRIKDNRYVLGSAWLQLTPPTYWENISLRYQLNYARFNDLTVDYYTYRPQVSHWLKLDLSKKWYCDKIVTEAGYWHCWQRSFESGQAIAVTPVAVFHWVNREIDAAYGRIKVVFTDRLNAAVTGTYSHDNFDYTTASATVNVHIRF